MTETVIPDAQRGRWERAPRVSTARFRTLALASLVSVVLIVATGAAVRLTDSGLGCPDWPSCYQHRLTARLSYHPAVEFGNRLVTVVLTIVLVATLLAALRRRPRRRDLVWLSVGLVAGVVVQAVLGGIVVYTKLNPYLVMVHFGASMLLVINALVLVHRSDRDYRPGSATPLVPRPIRLSARVIVTLVGVVVAAGTAVTGAGPHAGGSHGQIEAKRIPIALRSVAELHSSLALLLVGVALATVLALHAVQVPERVRRTGRILVIVLTAQAAVGYTQYFTHLPALLVEVHVIGATFLVIGSVQFLLALTFHPPEPPPPSAFDPPAAGVGVPTEPSNREGVAIGGW